MSEETRDDRVLVEHARELADAITPVLLAAIRAAVVAEREACAKIAIGQEVDHDCQWPDAACHESIAAAIRARGT